MTKVWCDPIYKANYEHPMKKMEKVDYSRYPTREPRDRPIYRSSISGMDIMSGLIGLLLLFMLSPFVLGLVIWAGRGIRWLLSLSS